MVYGIKPRIRKKLIAEVKAGAFSGDNDLNDWRKVHNDTVEELEKRLKTSDGRNILCREILVNMQMPSTPESFQVEKQAEIYSS